MKKTSFFALFTGIFILSGTNFAAEMDQPMKSIVVDDDDDNNNNVVIEKGTPEKVIQLPDAYVREPSTVQNNPVVKTRDERRIHYNRNINHHQDNFIHNHHHHHTNYHKNTHNHHKYRRHNIHSNTSSRSFSTSASYSSSKEILPDIDTVTTGVRTVVRTSFLPVLYSNYFCSPFYGGRFINACRMYFSF